MDKKRNKHFTLGSSIFLFSTLSASCFALPFSLTPIGTLPTTVTSGSTVSASYTITNLTGMTLNNNVVKTPPNVTSNGCSPSLNLASHASCTLSLTISGAVNKNNPSNADHLFVCLQDGTTCAGPTPDNSLNVSVTTSSGTRVGVGNASISIKGIQPLSYTSRNNGANWSDPSLLVIPVFSKYLAHLIKPMGGGTQGKLLGVACSANGSTCATVGVELSTSTPLGYYTTNGGSSWNFSNFTLPTGSNFTLNGIACDSSGLLCVAVGQYVNGVELPLSFTSTDGGINWTATSPNPPTLLTNSNTTMSGSTTLNGVACSANGSNCIAVGTTTLGTGGPLVYTTSNGGSTWSAANILTVTLNSSNKNSTLAGGSGIFYGIACNADGSECTTVGAKADGTSLSYKTYDSGTHWTEEPLTPPSLLITDRQANKRLSSTSALNSVACSANGMNCITAGYTTVPGNETPLTYQSSDGGATWGTFAYPPTLPGTTSTRLQGLTCNNSGTICTAVGYATISGLTQPISYSTTDGGTTWATPVTLTPPLDGLIYVLSSVSGSK